MIKISLKIHRITGVIMSVLFTMWCLTGIVLVYVGFPHASRQERFEHLEPLNLEVIQELEDVPKIQKGWIDLEMANGKPVYRHYLSTKKQTVYDAKSLMVFPAFDASYCQAIAESFTKSRVEDVEHMTALDSWIPWTYYKPLLPFFSFKMDDAAHRIVYVSSQTGEIVQLTTRQTRWEGRLGAIPHWIYFKQLHAYTGLRKTVVVILCIIGLLCCITGLVIGVKRFKRKENNSLKLRSVYKRWWYKWHHLSGSFFGLVMISFILSGMFYTTGVPSWMVEKGDSSAFQRQWNDKSPIELSLTIEEIWNQLEETASIRRISWGRSMQRPVVKIYRNDYKFPECYFIDQGKLSVVNVSFDDIEAYAQSCFANQKVSVSLQETHDSYYENIGMYTRPLPVYKVTVDSETDLYVDPLRGEVVTAFDQNKRSRRWLAKGLHKLDFPIFRGNDTLRKCVLIGLMMILLSVSITSLVLSVKWIKRKL